MSHSSRPIFFDPSKKRWPRIRTTMLIFGGSLFILACVSITTILLNPVLQTLNLPSSQLLPRKKQLQLVLPKVRKGQRQRALNAAVRQLHIQQRNEQAISLASTSLNTTSTQTQRIGFFVNWDDSSMSSLKQHLGSLDTVVGEWLHLADASGTVRLDNPAREHLAVDLIRSQKPSTNIFALINNYNGTSWQRDVLAQVLRNPVARANTITQIQDHLTQHHYAGVSIDFEDIPETSQPDFLLFIQELHTALSTIQKQMTVNVPADDAAFNYKAIAASSDQLVLMAYDEHWSSGSPGPISSMSWFVDLLLRRQKDIPANKIIVALGNYGYDWQDGQQAQEQTFEEAVLSARDSSAQIQLDPTSLNPTFDYSDDANNIHHVWMLDAVTAFNQEKVALSMNPAGIALWRLGSEDPSLWNFFGPEAALNATSSASLSTMTYGYDIDYEGKGEVLQITALPQPGHRDIHFDPMQNQITQETFTAYPSPYIITRHGYAQKKIVLSFDDGPDPVYTPQILDILIQKQTPALFFVIGANGEENPEILERELAEGHEIGSHTFTHPNIGNISATERGLEMSATQRLFEATLNRQTHLFRPPYAEDSEPETPDQIAPIQTVNQLGYITVGMQINPNDWQKPGVDAIVQRILDQADQGLGNIVLLHDAGGDRSQTIAALPRIIDTLRAHGYTIVSLANLLNVPESQLMPTPPPQSQWQQIVDQISFTLISFFLNALSIFFLIGIILGMARLFFIGALAIYQTTKQRQQIFSPSYDPSIAVIVPAYNEEKVVVQTIDSLLACDRPSRFEIVVVDDGSTDQTVARVTTAFGNHPNVTIITKQNAGKPAALNAGIARTLADIVICLDADTVFTKSTIKNLIRHFADPKIAAVAGNAKVGNRINLLTRMQALEYITSQNLDRRAFSALNCITVVPGAVGAWRRNVVLELGGFTNDTLAEDADLTLCIRKLGLTVVYDDSAIALTEAPDTINGFVKQRFRWMYGTMQAAWKHRDALFNPRYGSLGFIALPNIFLFQIFFPLISPIMDLTLVGTAIVSFISWQRHPLEFSADGLKKVVFYYAIFLATDILSSILAFSMERKEQWRLLFWIVWQRLVNRQLMYYVTFRSILTTFKGSSVGWNKVERKATVKDL